MSAAGRPPWSVWHWTVVAALLGLSAFVQLTTVLQTRHDGVVRGDAAKYVFYAYNLKYHHTFSHTRSFGSGTTDAPPPDKLTLPGYPAFLSLFVEGVPDTALVRRVTFAQGLLGIASTLLAFLIALHVLPLRWAAAAGALTAIQPHLAVMSTYLATEALFTTMMLAAVLAVLRASRPGSGWTSYAIAGLLLGTASLVRPQLQLLALLLPIVALLPRLRPWRKGIAIALVGFLVVLGPWQLRNAQMERREGAPDLLVNTLYHGAFPDFMYRGDPRTRGYAYRHDPASRTATRDLASVAGYIGDAFRRDPRTYARWYLLGKPGAFLSWGLVTGASDIFVYRVASSPFLERPEFRAMYLFSLLLHWPLMLLAILGAAFVLARAARKGGIPAEAVILAGFFLYLVLVHMLGAPYPRYNIPFRPIAFVLGLLALHGVVVATRNRQAMGAWPARDE